MSIQERGCPAGVARPAAFSPQLGAAEQGHPTGEGANPGRRRHWAHPPAAALHYYPGGSRGTGGAANE